MIEISHLRNDLEGLRSSISRKKFDCDLDALVESDLKRREAISATEQARAGQKAANSEISQLSQNHPMNPYLMARGSRIIKQYLLGEISRVTFRIPFLTSTYPGSIK